MRKLPGGSEYFIHTPVTYKTGLQEFFMRRPIFLLHGVRWLAGHGEQRAASIGRAFTRAGLCLPTALLLASALVSACSGPFAGGSSATPTPAAQALSHLSWCAKPAMVFRNEGAVTPTRTATPAATATATTTPAATATATATHTPGAPGSATAGQGTPTTMSDWSTVKANLGFTLYLPATLPNGSCLVSAQATIHDPIFGGSFTIGYLLPDHTSLSISEAPLTSQTTSFQCNPTSIVSTPTAAVSSKGTPTATPTTPSQLCSGAKDTTNIVLLGPGSERSLQQIFNHLQPDVNWIPA